MYSFKDYITESSTEGAVLEEIIVSVWNGEIPPTSKTISPDAGEKIVAYLKSKHITGSKASKLKTLGVQVTPEWSNFWKPGSVPSSTKTPKTDIMIGNNRISIKMGASQLMSGGKEESRATFYAACSKMGSIEKDLLEPIFNKMNDLAKTTSVKGKVDAAIKSNSDSILTKANEINNEVKSLMKETFSNNVEFRNNFVREAMTGEVKFGESAHACAEYILSSDPAGKTPHLYLIDDSFVNKVASKTTVTVRFKSVSEKLKGQKTGQYKYWSVVSLIVNKLEEETNKYDGQLINENVLSDIWNKVKQFITNLFAKIFAWMKQSIQHAIEFFDLQPDVSFSKINF